MSLHLEEVTMTTYSEYFELHFASIRSRSIRHFLSMQYINLHITCLHNNNSWSDIVTVWGLMKRPPWLKTRCTGAEMQGVHLETKTTLGLEDYITVYNCNTLAYCQKVLRCNCRFCSAQHRNVLPTDSVLLSKLLYVCFNCCCNSVHEKSLCPL